MASLYLIPKGGNAPAPRLTTQSVLFRNYPTFELLTFDFGGEAPVNIRFGFSELKITKQTDANSPGLCFTCATAARYDRVTLYFTKTVNNIETSAEIYTMGNVFVQAFQRESTFGDNMVTEAVTFRFSQLHHRYFQFNPNGTKGTPIDSSFDTVASSPWSVGTIDGPG